MWTKNPDRLEKVSENASVRFGRWWTFCAYDVNSGASIPIYRWRQMRHGQFWGGNEKSILGGMKKFNIKSVNFVHKFNN